MTHPSLIVVGSYLLLLLVRLVDTGKGYGKNDGVSQSEAE